MEFWGGVRVGYHVNRIELEKIPKRRKKKKEAKNNRTECCVVCAISCMRTKTIISWIDAKKRKVQTLEMENLSYAYANTCMRKE